MNEHIDTLEYSCASCVNNGAWICEGCASTGCIFFEPARIRRDSWPDDFPEAA